MMRVGEMWGGMAVAAESSTGMRVCGHHCHPFPHHSLLLLLQECTCVPLCRRGLNEIVGNLMMNAGSAVVTLDFPVEAFIFLKNCGDFDLNNAMTWQTEHFTHCFLDVARLALIGVFLCVGADLLVPCVQQNESILKLHKSSARGSRADVTPNTPTTFGNCHTMKLPPPVVKNE